ncbi:GmrSD restriction endonuclease domain-containing protein [Flavobacterium sp. 2]|uniref:GmrSD restriction endonuclease domain-containing protein n=1 Tax=Flavobacterium sp. 2 TaxID=308053 RepID=UPI003CE773DF
MIQSRPPELGSNPEKIDKLISRIKSGDIRIPAFQRSFVWKQNQVIELLDSIISNFPIGSVLLWSSKDKLNHTRNIAGFMIPETSEEYPVNYVLDGQQRISSIYAVFSKDVEQDKNYLKYNPNLDIFEIYYDFELKKFLNKNEIRDEVDSIIHLRNFLDVSSLFDKLKLLNSIYHEEAQNLCSKFLNYELPVVTIKYRTKEEVGLIFERINNTGTKLGTLDLMTAWTWTDDFHLHEKTTELFEDLDEKGFGALSQNILLQAISGFLQNDTTTKSVLNLKAEEIRDNWANFCEALKKAIDFVSTELLCRNIDFLPYQQQLVGLTKFFSYKNIPSVEEFAAIKRWFWRTSFSNRYSSGTTTEKMNYDIEIINLIRKKEFDGIETFKMNVTELELIGTNFSKANSLSRSFLLLMAQSHPKDLIKNIKVDLNTALSKYNRKEFHHAFPNAFLRDKKFQKFEIFSLMNFCFLSSDSNKKITNNKPSSYFFNLINQQEINSILESNLLPLDKTVYKDDDFQSFLQRRAELVLTEIKTRI